MLYSTQSFTEKNKLNSLYLQDSGVETKLVAACGLPTTAPLRISTLRFGNYAKQEIRGAYESIKP